MSECIIPNCRGFAPAAEAFCKEHRDVDPKDEIRRLRKALKFYADPVVYSMPVQDLKRCAFEDRGAIARAALNVDAQ